MSHACQILTFETDDKRKIQRECDDWGNWNCDPQERGGMYGGLGSGVKFTSRVFDSYEEAVEYLDGTFGHYDQTAVRYYKYPKREKTSAEKKLEAKIKTNSEKLRDLDGKPHYKDVKSQYIGCPECGSKLATAYCGKRWYNNCPVCGKDIRPATVIDRIANLKKTLKEANDELLAETRKQDKKYKDKAKLCWAVACEVHC